VKSVGPGSYQQLEFQQPPLADSLILSRLAVWSMLPVSTTGKKEYTIRELRIVAIFANNY
jgi:hypothetical protein